MPTPQPVQLELTLDLGLGLDFTPEPTVATAPAPCLACLPCLNGDPDGCPRRVAADAAELALLNRIIASDSRLR